MPTWEDARVRCPFCHKLVNSEATHCPSCGESLADIHAHGAAPSHDHPEHDDSDATR